MAVPGSGFVLRVGGRECGQADERVVSYNQAGAGWGAFDSGGLSQAPRAAASSTGAHVVDNAQLVHVMHHAAGGGRLSTFFAVDALAGTPRIAEPRQVLAVGLVFARRAPRTAGSLPGPGADRGARRAHPDDQPLLTHAGP